MPPSSTGAEVSRESYCTERGMFYYIHRQNGMMSEGFSEMKTINWVFQGDAEARRRWSMWLQLDDKIKKK